MLGLLSLPSDSRLARDTKLVNFSRDTAYRLPPTAYRLPPTAYRLPPTAYRLPPTAYRLGGWMDRPNRPRPPWIVNLTPQDPKNQNFTFEKFQTQLYIRQTQLYIRKISSPAKPKLYTTKPHLLSIVATTNASGYPLPMKLQKWTNRFAFELALKLEGSGEDVSEILERYNYSASDMLMFRSDPTFLKQVKVYREEIREKGMTFRVKARAQAEELLTTSWLLIHNPEVSPAVKADLIKSTVKWAGLDIGPNDGTSETSGVRITINLGNDDNTKVIDATTDVPKLDRVE